MSIRRLLFSLLAVTSVAACGSSTSSSSTGTRPKSTVTLFAAASTAAAMAKEITEFEARNPGITVQGDYEGTQLLLTKLEADSSVADVFVSADRAHMDSAAHQQLVLTPQDDLASNRLAIALPPGNPAHITSLADLARPGVHIDLADTSVPAGNYAQQALHLTESRGDAPAGFAAAVLANVVSRESDVEQVVAKVAAGTVDAGIVYVTDARANSHISTLDIPIADQPATVYSVAVVTHARDAVDARAFVAFLLSAEGQRILRTFGFLAPPPSP